MFKFLERWRLKRRRKRWAKALFELPTDRPYFDFLQQVCVDEIEKLDRRLAQKEPS